VGVDRGTRTRRRGAAIGLAVALWLGGCGEKAERDELAATESEEVAREVASREDAGRAANDEAPSAGHVVAEGPFEITFPPGFPPPERGTMVEVVDGAPVEITTYLSTDGAKRRMAGVSFNMIPEERHATKTPEEALRDAKDGAVAAMGAEVLAEDRFELAESPVYVVLATREVQGTQAFFRVQFQLVERHLVQAMFTTTQQAGLSDSIANAFFASLKVSQ
jgi:hypothetical protein